MFLGFLHLILLGASLRVEGDVSCPTPAQVSTDIQTILNVSEDYAPKLHATMNRDGAWLDLTLTGADGNSLGERRLAANEDCAVLSRAAAVVIASWLTDEHPEYLVALPSADAAAKLKAESDAASAPAAPLASTEPRTTAAAARAVAATRTLGDKPPTPALPPARPAHPPLRLALAGAIGGTWGSSEFAPSAWLGASLDPGQPGFGAQLSVAWIAARSEAFATEPQAVSWTRWPVMLGPYLRFTLGTSTFELEAGPTLAWVRLQGENLEQSRTRNGAQLGVYGALRFMPKAGAWHPFVMAAPLLWFLPHTEATEREPGSTPGATTRVGVAIPSVDVMLTAGVRFLP